MLQLHAGLSLIDRRNDIQRRLGVSLHTTTLRSYYIRNNVKVRTVDLHNVNKLNKADEIREQQKKFVMELMRSQIDKQVYYMDQTSVNLWYTCKKTWTTVSKPVYLPMQATGYRNVTIYGIIGGNSGEFIHMVTDKTNSDNTQAFLQQFLHLASAPHEEIIIVADNHSSHKSRSTKIFLLKHNIQMLYLPPYSSPLNPIEHIWASFKVLWRKKLALCLSKIPKDQLENMVNEVLEQVKYTPNLLMTINSTIRRVLNDELV